MNAPGICKLLNGVNKAPQFLRFSTAEGGTKTCALVNCKGVDLIQERNEF
jgi:hypothetical protein